MNIQIFQLKGIDIEMLFRKGTLACTYTYEGKPFGNSIKLPSRKVEVVVAATFQLLTNALETIEALEKLKNENI
jgi:hypothetical protein